MKFVHLTLKLFFFSFQVTYARRESDRLIQFIIKVLPRSMGFSACNDYMQTTKQYYSKSKNGGSHAITEDKYATPGASFIDISLTSQ